MKYLSKIASIENLEAAFRHVAANRASAGIDRITIDQFREQLDTILPSISQQLLTASYQFQPALTIELEERTVAVLTVQDRVVSQAISQILNEPFEKYFHPASYAYRIGRSAVQATIDLYELLQKTPHLYILRCDIYHYFDEIQHNILYTFLQWTLGEQNHHTIRLILKALKQPYMLHGQLKEPAKGICQGAPLSPLLSNLYLTPLDKYIDKQGFQHFRFCDDLAILVEHPQKAEELYQEIEHFLKQQLGLKLHPEKKKIVAFQKGFEFLGFHLSPKGRFPGKSACQRLYQKLQATQTSQEQAEAIQRWEAYFGPNSASYLKYFQTDSTFPTEKDPRAHIPPLETKEKIPSPPPIVSVFLRLFRGNPTCFAQAYKTKNRYGYTPIQRPLSESDLIDHILGKKTLGIYLLHNNQAACTCLDLDLDQTIMQTHYHTNPAEFLFYQDRLLQHARSIQRILQSLELEPLLEESGYKGYHLWLFFREFTPSAKILAFWKKILQYAGNAPKKTKREIFPRESKTYKLGSLIKLPLAIHPLSGCRSMFLDHTGEPISNPYHTLSQVQLAPSSILDDILQDVRVPSLPSSPLDSLLQKCQVVHFLCEKAKQEKHLSHFERIILLYTLGQLGEPGSQYLHYILRHCTNYNYNYTQRQIEKKHPSPMGCRKIQEMMGDLLNFIECHCVFEIPSGGYASPLLHVYPNATKNLACKIHKSNIRSTSR